MLAFIKKLWASSAIRFALSSLLAFTIDYLLMLLLMRIFPSVPHEIILFITWCVSSITNFFVNRTFVFHSSAPLLPALGEYYSLAAIVFVLKTYVLIEILTRVLHIPVEIAKPIGEITFFIVNFMAQKFIVFKRK